LINIVLGVQEIPIPDAIRVWVLRKDRRGPDRQDAVGPSPGRIVGA